MAIDIRNLVTSTPSVLSGGGSSPSMASVFLTNNTAVPIGQAKLFTLASAVSAFFGSASAEALAANIYFSGFQNSTVKPNALYFWQYPSANVAAYLRGGNLGSMTLTQLKALSGVLTMTVDGVVKTTTTINLTAATSFSNAATIISAGFTSGPVVAFDAQRNAFTFTSNTTGASSTITYATGTLSAGLLLTQALGAETSQGTVAGVPATSMDSLLATTKKWATFTTLFEPVTADKTLFALWTTSKTDRVYFAWDTDIGATQNGNLTSFGVLAKAAQYNGVCPLYNRVDDAAFWAGTVASVDWTRREGRIAFAYRSQAGLTAAVTDDTIYANLIANGYNFYGQFSSNVDTFSFCQTGAIPGAWKWLDTYINEIYLNQQIQTAVVNLLLSVNSLPYSDYGYALLRAACTDPIKSFITFGGIRAGVPLSDAQKTQINGAAGVDVSGEMFTEGYYLQILPADAQTRSNRTSPPITLWYMDGGSIRTVNLASIAVA
jgi:hypothetical protein